MLDLFYFHHHPYRFRNGPVAHTGKRGHYGYLRYMHTQSERRAYAGTICDAEADGVKLRAARAMNNLPTSWDDFWRRPQRSWKRQRKTRWR